MKRTTIIIALMSFCILKNLHAAQKDLDFIKQTLIENHPGYAKPQDAAFVHALMDGYEQASKKSAACFTTEAHAHLLRQYVQHFNDPHVFISFFNPSLYCHPRPHRYLLEHTIGYEQIVSDVVWIFLPTFDPTPDQQQKMKEIIAHMPEWRTKKTIIFDLRGNTGGNSAWGFGMLGGLFGKKFIAGTQQTTIVDWRASLDNLNHCKQIAIQFKDKFQSNHFAHEWIKEVCAGMNDAYTSGQSLYQEKTEAYSYKSTKKRVAARIIGIIDRSCGSSTLDFLDILTNIKHSVVLVGQETNFDTQYSEWRSVALPSNLGMLHFPIKAYRLRMHKGGQTYLPNYFCPEQILNDTTALQAWVFDLMSKQTF